VVLGLTSDLRGIVRDPYGTPVAGARIQIVGAGREEAISDGQGRFTIAWERRLQFRAATEFYLVARHEPRNLAAAVTVGRGTPAVEVRLQPGVTLTGQVVDLVNRPIAHAWAYATWNVPNWGDTPLAEEQIETDSSGRFELTAVPPGILCTIHACADGYGSKDQQAGVQAGAQRVLDVGLLSLSSATLSVSGHVRDGQGNPVADAAVYGWGQGQPIKLRTQTDGAGRFTLAGVCPGQVNLRIDSDLGNGRHTWTRARAGANDLEIGPPVPWASGTTRGSGPQ